MIFLKKNYCYPHKYHCSLQYYKVVLATMPLKIMFYFVNSLRKFAFVFENFQKKESRDVIYFELIFLIESILPLLLKYLLVFKEYNNFKYPQKNTKNKKKNFFLDV